MSFTRLHVITNATLLTYARTRLQKQLPFHLLSDPNRVLIGALGAADGNKTKRSHFVFEKGGKLIHKKMPLKPADRYVCAMLYRMHLG